jgi:hypothetical protein
LNRSKKPTTTTTMFCGGDTPHGQPQTGHGWISTGSKSRINIIHWTKSKEHQSIMTATIYQAICPPVVNNTTNSR